MGQYEKKKYISDLFCFLLDWLLTCGWFGADIRGCSAKIIDCFHLLVLIVTSRKTTSSHIPAHHRCSSARISSSQAQQQEQRTIKIGITYTLQGAWKFRWYCLLQLTTRCYFSCVCRYVYHEVITLFKVPWTCLPTYCIFESM